MSKHENLYISPELEDIFDVEAISDLSKKEIDESFFEKLYCSISCKDFSKKIEIQKYSKKYYKKVISMFVEIETAAIFLMEKDFDIKIFYSNKEIVCFSKNDDLFFNIIKDKEKYRLDITVYEEK